MMWYESSYMTEVRARMESRMISTTLLGDIGPYIECGKKDGKPVLWAPYAHIAVGNVCP